MSYEDRKDFSALLGRTLTTVTGAIGDHEIVFVTNTGETFKLLHNQDCCESVSVEDITGDLADLIGSPIVLAEESTSDTATDREAGGCELHDELLRGRDHLLAIRRRLESLTSRIRL